MNARQIYALTLLDQTIRNIISSKASPVGNVSDVVDDIDSCHHDDDGTLDIDHLEDFFRERMLTKSNKARQQFLVTVRCGTSVRAIKWRQEEP